MRKIAIYLCSLWVCCLAACSDDDKIGYVEPWEDEYILPQGKSDADARIVDFYEQYGTYILYDFTYLDFRYELSSYEFELPDPTYVGDILDLLDETWFDFYPEDFKKKYLPLKIFLAEMVTPNTDGYICLLGSSSIGIVYCTDVLREFTAEEKSKFMWDLQTNLWSNYLDILDFPEEFFEVSSYATVADTDPESSNYSRARGFVEDYPYDSWNSTWYQSGDWETGEIDKEQDLNAFIMGMLVKTSADWARDLEWPLVKKKYDMLRNWIIDTYGFDLQKIGDTTYE